MPILSFILCAALSSCCAYSQLPLQKHAASAVFVFGDSLFDPGNNHYINTDMQADFWPYGESFFKIPTGRHTDGRVIPDFIAEYAKLPITSPYLQPGDHCHFVNGASFASAGAGALVETHRGRVISLETQLSYFMDVEKLWRKEFGNADARHMISRAVFLFCFGVNDYQSSFLTKPISQKRELVEMVIGNMTSAVKEIYKKGGHKFGFIGLPAIGCFPSLRMNQKAGGKGRCFEEASSMTVLHNRVLFKRLQKLSTDLRGFNFSIFNLHPFLNQRINHPSKYGLKEGKTACCGSGPYRGVPSCGGRGAVKEYTLCRNAREHVFFDSVHPSERVNQQFAEIMWSGAPTVTAPYNLRTLFQSPHA